jgi:hypothetical protein
MAFSNICDLAGDFLKFGQPNPAPVACNVTVRAIPDKINPEIDEAHQSTKLKIKSKNITDIFVN